MKKLLIIGALAVSALVSNAAVYREQPFLNGWNLYITNGTAAVGVTNQLFTSPQGQILYSLTNNTVNGVLNTNTIVGDAFDASGNNMTFNLNGDIVANGAIHYAIDFTNLIPVSVTNSQGQYFVTNSWPLFTSQYPTYMYPATTNVYPSLPNASATNVITFNFQRGWSINLGSQAYTWWDTSTNVFNFSVNGNGFNPVAGITNLPIAFTQGATQVRLHDVTVAPNSSATGSGMIVNEVSLGQPQP